MATPRRNGYGRGWQPGGRAGGFGEQMPWKQSPMVEILRLQRRVKGLEQENAALRCVMRKEVPFGVMSPQPPPPVYEGDTRIEVVPPASPVTSGAAAMVDWDIVRQSSLPPPGGPPTVWSAIGMRNLCIFVSTGVGSTPLVGERYEKLMHFCHNFCHIGLY